MTQKKIVYYIAFPVFTALLCLFTYRLGFERGVSHSKKEQISKVLDELEKTEGDGSKLTYYEDLHGEKNPIVEQVNSDRLKKSIPNPVPNPLPKTPNVASVPSTTTVTSITPSSQPAPSASTPVLTNKAPEPPTVTSGLSVQVGAFTDLGKADELTDRLKNFGFDAYTKPVQSKGNELYRVLVKSPKDSVSAVQSKLSTQGFHNTFVVTK